MVQRLEIPESQGSWWGQGGAEPQGEEMSAHSWTLRLCDTLGTSSSASTHLSPSNPESILWTINTLIMKNDSGVRIVLRCQRHWPLNSRHLELTMIKWLQDSEGLQDSSVISNRSPNNYTVYLCYIFSLKDAEHLSLFFLDFTSGPTCRSGNQGPAPDQSQHFLVMRQRSCPADLAGSIRWWRLTQRSMSTVGWWIPK